MKRLVGSTDPSASIGSGIRYRRLIIPAIAGLVVASCGNTSNETSQGSETLATADGGMATEAPTVPGQEQSEDNTDAQPVSAGELEITADIFDKPLPDIDFGYDTSTEEINKTAEWLNNPQQHDQYLVDLSSSYLTNSLEPLIESGYTKDDLIVLWYVAARNYESIDEIYTYIKDNEETQEDSARVIGIFQGGAEDSRWAYTFILHHIKQLQQNGMLDSMPTSASLHPEPVDDVNGMFGVVVAPSTGQRLRQELDSGESTSQRIERITESRLGLSGPGDPGSIEDYAATAWYSTHSVSVLDDLSLLLPIVEQRNSANS